MLIISHIFLEEGKHWHICESLNLNIELSKMEFNFKGSSYLGLCQYFRDQLIFKIHADRKCYREVFTSATLPIDTIQIYESARQLFEYLRRQPDSITSFQHGKLIFKDFYATEEHFFCLSLTDRFAPTNMELRAVIQRLQEQIRWKESELNRQIELRGLQEAQLANDQSIHQYWLSFSRETEQEALAISKALAEQTVEYRKDERHIQLLWQRYETAMKMHSRPGRRRKRIVVNPRKKMVMSKLVCLV